MAQGDPCGEGKYGCQNCGGGSTTAGNGQCHVCSGSGFVGLDPCTTCNQSGTCRNCGGTGCL